MPGCQNQLAGRYAFPRGPMPVEDRRMTLEVPCHESATHVSHLNGMGGGKERRGATPREFFLCDNHAQLFEMIDRELVEEGWKSSFVEPAQRLP